MDIFDGHNDLLSRIWASGEDAVDAFRGPTGHINEIACRQGRFRGGFFALYAPSKRAPFDFSQFKPEDDGPLPPALPIDQAARAILDQAGIAARLDRAGLIRLMTEAPAVQAGIGDGGPPVALLHLEGCDGIDADLTALEALYSMGLRSLGPVWSRPNLFGHGVPFGWGKDGDTGPGLTPLGLKLLQWCRARGVIVDTSHLTAKGFWQVADTGMPVVATHSNAYEICPTTRNLTDAQLRTIGETGGMVGLNFATLFLSESGWRSGVAGLDDCLRHLEHMIDKAGETAVGLGSDFDGAPLPAGLSDAGDLPALVAAMRRADFGEDLIARICHGNWMGFLSRNLGIPG